MTSTLYCPTCKHDITDSVLEELDVQPNGLYTQDGECPACNTPIEVAVMSTVIVVARDPELPLSLVLG